jgi:hypothetical protein
MSALHKLSIRQRLFAIVLAFCIPIGVLFFFVNKGFQDIINFAQDEINGNEFQLTAVPVLENLTNLKIALHKGSDNEEIIAQLNKDFAALKSSFNQHKQGL